VPQLGQSSWNDIYNATRESNLRFFFTCHARGLLI